MKSLSLIFRNRWRKFVARATKHANKFIQTRNRTIKVVFFCCCCISLQQIPRTNSHNKNTAKRENAHRKHFHLYIASARFFKLFAFIV